MQATRITGAQLRLFTSLLFEIDNSGTLSLPQPSRAGYLCAAPCHTHLCAAFNWPSTPRKITSGPSASD
jgi:hypothetical protein